MFNLRSLLFRIWYWYVNKVDKNADVLFMNYGYEDPDEVIPMDLSDEPNRYPIQLYHRLTRNVDLKNKNILEIGSGRGGGLAYISKRFLPSSAIGIDLDYQAVSFSNSYHSHDSLSFRQGDAQCLELDNDTFDAVINVESSHRYPDMNSFLSEVYRILKPNGYFLFTDFRYPYEMPALRELLSKSNLDLVEEQRINSNVINALNLDTERRKKLVLKLTPRFLHKTALNFAGTTGTSTFNQIISGDYEYFLYVLQKKPVDQQS